MTLNKQIEELKETLVKLAISIVQAAIWFGVGSLTAWTAGGTGKAVIVAGVTSALPYLVGNIQRTGDYKLTLDGYRRRQARDCSGDARKPGAKP